jgi:hypothetical protein
MILFILHTLYAAELPHDDALLLLNSNAGHAMYSAQHAMHGTDFQTFAAAPLPEQLLERKPNEAQWDRELMYLGLAYVVTDPGRYLRLSGSRILDYFEFWPTDTTLLHNVGRLASFTLFLPFFIEGFWLGIRKQKASLARWHDFLVSPVMLALLFISFYSLLHILTWAMSRRRLPVDAVAMPFAALACIELWRLLRRRAPAGVQSRRLRIKGL